MSTPPLTDTPTTPRNTTTPDARTAGVEQEPRVRRGRSGHRQGQPLLTLLCVLAAALASPAAPAGASCPVSSESVAAPVHLVGVAYTRMSPPQARDGVVGVALPSVREDTRLQARPAQGGPQDPGTSAEAGTTQLIAVLNNIVKWLIGILATVATLFLTIAGVRYLIAAGDPGEVAAAKAALRSAAIGYALAVLAPAVVSILRQIVGSTG